MRVLIIGYGSIAKKHIEALKNIYGEKVELGALRHNLNASDIQDVTSFYSYEESKNFNPDFVIISNPTSEHITSINYLINWKIPIFIEKPLSHTLSHIDNLSHRLRNILTYTACNLRFLGCINFMKNFLSTIDQNNIQEINIYCGSYLPDWRSNEDFRQSYSAIPNLGGGVHLDLIHEIDYLIYLFGFPTKSLRLLRSESSLGIDAIDYAHFILEYTKYTATVTLNYYRPKPKRTLEIITNSCIYSIDLINNNIFEEVSGQYLYQGSDSIKDTYEAQLRYFIKFVTSNKKSIMNSFDEASRVLKIVIDE